MNTYWLKRLRKKGRIVKRNNMWFVEDAKYGTGPAHMSHSSAMFYFFEEYLGMFTFLDWVKKRRKRHFNRYYFKDIMRHERQGDLR